MENKNKSNKNYDSDSLTKEIRIEKKRSIKDVKVKTKKSQKKLGFVEELFKNNNSLRIISVVVAVLFWTIVSLYIDPTTTKRIDDIIVDIDSESPILQRLNLAPVDFKIETVSVSVSGNMGDLRALSADDFTGKILLNGVTGPGEYELDIEVVKNNESASYDINDRKIGKIKVEFDHTKTETFALSAEIGNINIVDGYIKGETLFSPKEVTVTGPKKYIDKIKNATVSLNNIPEKNKVLDETFASTGSIKLFDVDGKQIDTQHILFDKKDATVTIPILKTKTFPLSLEFTNLPVGFPVEDLNLVISPKNVTLAGSKNVIDSLSDQINFTYFDFRDLTPETVFSYNFIPPSGCEVVNDNLDVVKFELSMPNFTTKSFNIPQSQISLLNVPNDFDISIVTESIKNITIVGDKNILETLTSKDIIAEVDLFDRSITPGTMKITAHISVPNKGTVWASGKDYTVLLNVAS